MADVVIRPWKLLFRWTFWTANFLAIIVERFMTQLSSTSLVLLATGERQKAELRWQSPTRMLNPEGRAVNNVHDSPGSRTRDHPAIYETGLNLKGSFATLKLGHSCVKRGPFNESEWGEDCLGDFLTSRFSYGITYKERKKESTASWVRKWRWPKWKVFNLTLR